MSSNVETIADAHRAFARRDTQAILERLSPDVEWRIPETLPYGGTYRARKGVAEFYTALEQHWDRYELVLDRLVDGGSIVVSIGRFEGIGPGGEFVSPFVLVWELVDGQVVRMQQYTDTASMLVALDAATKGTAGPELPA